MSPLRRAALLLCCLAPCVVLAHDFSADLSAGGTPATDRNPRTGYLSLGLNGSYEATDSVAISLGANLSRDLPTPNLREPPNNVLLFLGAVDWLVNDHWALSGLVAFSPRSSQVSPAPFEVGPYVYVEPRRVTSASLGATLALSFFTANFSGFESSVDASLSLTRFATTKQILLEGAPPPPPGTPPLLSACMTFQDDDCRLLRAQSADRNELELSAGYTATLAENTELGLEGAWYLHPSPIEARDYAAETTGRAPLFEAAPLLFTLRPHAAHRFGAFTVRGWYQYDRYVADEGFSHSAGLTLQYKLTRLLRASLSLGVQRSADQARADPPSASLSTGVHYRF